MVKPDVNRQIANEDFVRLNHPASGDKTLTNLLEKAREIDSESYAHNHIEVNCIRVSLSFIQQN